MTQAGNSDPLVGQRFGQDGCFLLERRLGGGAFGDVYLARDEKANRQVAMKFLRDTGVSATSIGRFKREGAKYGLMFKHPNIVRVYLFGKERNRLFIVSEYVDGRTLADLVDSEGALAVDEALRITKEIALGLQAAHRANVVHRDLKPGNVMIRTADRAVKILDFGIAKDIMSSVGMRTVGYVGTAGYSAPEQTSADDVDQRADIFSLGAILYEMLTGTFAFKGKATLEIVNATRHLDPIPPGEISERVTRPVAALIDRMIQKSRRRRPGDLGEVIDAITAIQAGVAPALAEEEKRGLRAWLTKVFER